jgi:hypothetical protein
MDAGPAETVGNPVKSMLLSKGIQPLAFLMDPNKKNDEKRG